MSEAYAAAWGAGLDEGVGLEDLSTSLPSHDCGSELIVQRFPLSRIERGTTLMRQGEWAEDIYFVSTGLLKLVHTFPNGVTRIMGLRYPGSLAGVEAMSMGSVQNATATTLTPCLVRRLPSFELCELLRNDPTVVAWAHRICCRELQREFAHHALVTGLAARERVLALIRHLEAEFPNTDRSLEPLLRNWELAQLAGVTSTYVSTLLRELESEGELVRRGSRWISGRPSYPVSEVMIGSRG